MFDVAAERADAERVRSLLRMRSVRVRIECRQRTIDFYLLEDAERGV